jgi:hypothetical protein
MTRLRWLAAALAFFALLIAGPACAKTPRNGYAREAFRSTHPCPATGETRGPCAGYVIDHIEPLCAGGADAPENMQWQAADEALLKDDFEREVCAAMRR